MKKKIGEKNGVANPESDALKDIIRDLGELPTEVLEQLLKNLDDIEEYNKTHPDGDSE